jgi:hypothetical protein
MTEILYSKVSTAGGGGGWRRAVTRCSRRGKKLGRPVPGSEPESVILKDYIVSEPGRMGSSGDAGEFNEYQRGPERNGGWGWGRGSGGRRKRRSGWSGLRDAAAIGSGMGRVLATTMRWGRRREHRRETGNERGAENGQQRERCNCPCHFYL